MYQLFQTIIFFLLFIAISILVLYIPGFAVIARIRKQLEDQEVIALSLSLGIVSFVLIAISLALLNLRYLMLLFLLSINLFIVLKYKLDAFKSWKIFIRNKTLLALIVMGILIQGFINFPSGYLYKNGLQFWSSQGHDGLWHISLMEEIKKEIPPKNPIFAGEDLYNYHYLVDALMGEFLRVFPFFSSLDLYFRFFPVIFSILIGISVFAFVKRWQDNKIIGYLAIFFTYFVGSFGYIVLFIRTGNIFGGETVFWASQQNTLLGNPPHAISHGLLAAFFLSFIIYLKERNTIWVVISFLIGSTLAGFKVSGGFVMLAGLGAASIVDFINKRKFLTLILSFSLGLSNLLTFKWMTTNGSSFLMFLPWWFVRTMIVDKLGWMDLELRRQHYLSKGTWNAYLRVLQLELIALAIFIIGNLGMRFLGIIELIRKFILGRGTFLKDPIEVMLMVTMLTGLIIPMLFVQKGLIFNNIQFIQYFLFIFGFYGAISTYKILANIKNRLIKLAILVLVVVLSLPTVIGNLVEFYGLGTNPLAKITPTELEALSYLKNNSEKDAIILNMPFDKYLSSQFPIQPWPIYAWYSTAYIPALAGRRTYLSSEEQALITGYPINDRLSKMQSFFEQKDFSFNRKFLKDANISYIYTTKSEIKTSLDVLKNDLKIFFENNEVIIYKVAGLRDILE